MDAVSVYRVGADAADQSCFFGPEARGGDLLRAEWLGWLPLSLVDFAGPGVAEAGDAWLTAPSGGSRASRPVVPGDLVIVDDAAAELAARREYGLEAFTDRFPPLSGDGSLSRRSLALVVAEDLADRLARVRAACAAVGEAAGAVEPGPAVPAEGDAPVSSDAPAHRSRGRALRDLEECQHRLHLLLDAAVRIGTFCPAARAA